MAPGGIDLKLSQKVLILVTVPIVSMLAFVGILTNLQKQAEEAIWQERHYKDVSNECNSLMNNLMDAGMTLHLYQSTHEDSFLKRFDSDSQAVADQIRLLKQMSQDSPERKKMLSALDDTSNKALRALHRAREGAAGGLPVTAADYVTTSAEALSTLRALVKEQQRLAPSNQSEERARFLIGQCLVVGVLTTIVLAVILAILFNRSTTRRLLILVQNSERLAANRELLPRLTGRDEIANLDRTFHAMAKALDEAAQYKQELLSIVSHDLRSPLSSIHVTLTLLSEGVFGKLSDKAQVAVQGAEGSATRLIALINDLLDVEKMQSGTLTLNRKQTAAIELMDQAEQAVLALAKKSDIEITVVETDLVLNVDGDRITQVLTNLLSNAIKFSPAHSKITMTAQRIDKEVEFRVKDEGRGIPQEFIRTIFDPYGQVKAEDSARGRGTGLGLSICKSFVEAHGGLIGAFSEEGKGSTFWFRLPL